MIRSVARSWCNWYPGRGKWSCCQRSKGIAFTYHEEMADVQSNGNSVSHVASMTKHRKEQMTKIRWVSGMLRWNKQFDKLHKILCPFTTFDNRGEVTPTMDEYLNMLVTTTDVCLKISPVPSEKEVCYAFYQKNSWIQCSHGCVPPFKLLPIGIRKGHQTERRQGGIGQLNGEADQWKPTNRWRCWKSLQPMCCLDLCFIW